MTLLRTAARASVATRVIGNTHRRQQQRWAQQDAAAADVGHFPQVPAAAHQGMAPLIDQLTRLGELRDSGVLTEEEFVEQKQRLLAQQ